MDKKKLKAIDLGFCEYGEALKVQYEVLEKVQNGDDDTLLLVEHPPVLTLGRNADKNNILFTEEHLKDKGVQVSHINRGGDVTYHGPGQLVGYPIFNIKKNHGGSIKQFVYNLEEVFIRLLKEEYGLSAGRNECNAGVWIGQEKIVAVGLAVKRGVTMHGFAFNINTNLEHFGLIIPCGLQGKGITSLEKIEGKRADFQKAKDHIIKHFIQVYSYSNMGL